MYDVNIENFQGPLDLLLKLIEKEELDISNISIAGIAVQYLEYVQSQDTINAEEIGDFLFIAGKLLYIKSKILLPHFSFKEDEDINELEQQLKIYKEFLIASQNIEELSKENNQMYFPKFNKGNFSFIDSEKKHSFSKNISKESLFRVYQDLLLKIKKDDAKELEKQKINTVVSIDEKINMIKKMIGNEVGFNFDKLLKKAKSRTEVIVSFLAILELTKQKVIIISQKKLFASIKVNSNEYK